MNDNEHRWLAHAVCGALRAATRLNAIGLVLGGLSLLAILLHPASLSGLFIGISVVWTLMEMLLMVRIAIDQSLFAALAQTDQSEDDTLAALDEALLTLGWLKPARPKRSVAERARATLRFLRWSAIDAVLRVLGLLTLLLWQLR